MWISQGGFRTSLRHCCRRERGRRRKELWDIKLNRSSSGSWRGAMLHSGAVGRIITQSQRLLYFCIDFRRILMEIATLRHSLLVNGTKRYTVTVCNFKLQKSFKLSKLAYIVLMLKTSHWPLLLFMTHFSKYRCERRGKLHHEGHTDIFATKERHISKH